MEANYFTILWWFFAIHSHESAMGVHVFPILNPLPPPSASYPSGSSQCTNPEHPVSWIKPALVICFTYDNIHVSVIFSQIIPPLPSPTESKRLFYTSVPLLKPPPPSLPIPSLWALGALFHALNLDWSSVLHMVMYMFQCCSQIIPPLPSPTESKSLFFTSVSPLLPTLHVGLLVLSFYISYICVNIQYSSFSFWLTSLCIIGSSFIHYIRTDSNVFFFMAE